MSLKKLALIATAADQLVSTLSYPMFVLISSLAAVLVILLFVVPTLAPLVQSSGASAPPTLQALLWASRMLSSNLLTLSMMAGAGVGITVLLWRLRLLAEPADRALLDGPFSKVRRGLVYGQIGQSL
jgi:type II secretory pathway component PulF